MEIIYAQEEKSLKMISNLEKQKKVLETQIRREVQNKVAYENAAKYFRGVLPEINTKLFKMKVADINSTSFFFNPTKKEMTFRTYSKYLHGFSKGSGEYINIPGGMTVSKDHRDLVNRAKKLSKHLSNELLTATVSYTCFEDSSRMDFIILFKVKPEFIIDFLKNSK